MHPLFVVLEGIDGCGKSTQAVLLGSWLFSTHKSANIMLTREPTGLSSAGKRLRKLLAEKGSEKNAKEFLRLFVQDRAFHVQKIIKPALKAGAIVISERYYHSAFAYQMAQGLSFKEIKNAHKGMPRPDLTVILDLNPAEAIQRLASRGKKSEFFEKEGFLKKVRENYLHLPKIFRDEKISIVQSKGSEEEVFQKVRKEFLKVWEAAQEQR